MQFPSQLLADGRLYLIGNKLCPQKVFINLRVQILTVCNNEKGKVADAFVLDFAGKHNYIVAFAAALDMPENTSLAV